MLTKEHLKHRIRQNRVKPVWLAGTAEELRVADHLVSVFDAAPGRLRADIDADVSRVQHPLVPAFSKLLWDRVEEEEDDGSVASFRWDVLEAAEQKRRAMEIDSSPDMLRRALAEQFSCAESALGQRLYADLPEARAVRSFRHLSGEQLVHRYNCAQVQGLLLHAKSVQVDLKGTSLAERRAFFRHLKFYRLLSLVESDPAGDGLVVELSGPLSLFEANQAYGMRLAQFFPYILHLSKYKVVAEVRVKRKDLVLSFDQKCGVESHYKKRDLYIPKELKECVALFQKKYGESLDCEVESNQDFLHLGSQSYCFPDLKVTDANGIRYIEFFHRWHASQLQHRLSAMGPDTPLLLGVASQVAKNADLAGHSHFIFREFPTPKQIRDVLYKT